jgi:hypothetical protein
MWSERVVGALRTPRCDTWPCQQARARSSARCPRSGTFAPQNTAGGVAGCCWPSDSDCRRYSVAIQCAAINVLQARSALMCCQQAGGGLKRSFGVEDRSRGRQSPVLDSASKPAIARDSMPARHRISAATSSSLTAADILLATSNKKLATGSKAWYVGASCVHSARIGCFSDCAVRRAGRHTCDWRPGLPNCRNQEAAGTTCCASTSGNTLREMLLESKYDRIRTSCICHETQADVC